jgi:hypothetical protein
MRRKLQVKEIASETDGHRLIERSWIGRKPDFSCVCEGSIPDRQKWASLEQLKI